MRVHAVVRLITGLFRCEACPFETDDLTEVVRHVVANQYTVR